MLYIYTFMINSFTTQHSLQQWYKVRGILWCYWRLPRSGVRMTALATSSARGWDERDTTENSRHCMIHDGWWCLRSKSEHFMLQVWNLVHHEFHPWGGWWKMANYWLERWMFLIYSSRPDNSSDGVHMALLTVCMYVQYVYASGCACVSAIQSHKEICLLNKQTNKKTFFFRSFCLTFETD